MIRSYLEIRKRFCNFAKESIKKVKVREFLEKEEVKLVRRKVDERFAYDFSTTTTDQYFKSIAKY